jgi:phosphopantetheinyl transferase (holo-ACP synthase)
MIIGIGSDLIDIRRVAKVIERHGERFLDRIFTEAERAKAGAAPRTTIWWWRPMPSGLPPRKPVPRR